MAQFNALEIDYLNRPDLLYVLTKINTLLETYYVEKDGDKVLSDVNFTQALKDKLDGIADDMTKIIVDATLTATSTNPVEGKAIYEAIQNILNSPTFTGTPKAPTAGSGTNDEQIATTAFVTAAIETAISGVSHFEYEVVDGSELPLSGETGKIYLLEKTGGKTEKNKYEEYVWVNGAWEYIGDTGTVDLAGYVKAEDLVPISTEEIDSIFQSVFGS